MLKVLGVGLSKTGTKSLTDALTILGYNTLHWCPERLEDIVRGKCQEPDFRRFDDVDAVTDIPAAWFYKELYAAYPGLQCILTVRDPDEWFASVKFHYSRLLDPDPGLQQLVYGSDRVSKFLYQKRFADHTAAVQAAIPKQDLLIMDVKQGWEPLCRFLSKPVPIVEFPNHQG